MITETANQQQNKKATTTKNEKENRESKQQLDRPHLKRTKKKHTHTLPTTDEQKTSELDSYNVLGVVHSYDTKKKSCSNPQQDTTRHGTALRLLRLRYLLVDNLPKLCHSVKGLLPGDVGNDERSVQASEGVPRYASILLLRHLLSVTSRHDTSKSIN